MKKISLKNLNFKEVEQLSREQLKNVLGGYVGLTGGEGGAGGTSNDGCVFRCSSDCPCKNAEDWCDNGYCKRRPRM